MNFTRYIHKAVAADIKSKIVMIGGPRQVGKTTLSKIFISKPEQYLNWDLLEDRELLKSHRIDPALGTVVLDEIHKYARWRGLIKGLYDKYEAKLRILVTGSAKLDHFRKGGDSLFGRFYYYRLHPLSLGELGGFKREDIKNLLEFGGFPEPYIKASSKFLRRWQKERLSRVVYQDLNDLSRVKELSLVELLVEALPIRVGSSFSMNSLGEDLQVSPNTIKVWIELLERVYYCYRIQPYGPPKIRAVKKASKLYLWDWSEVEDSGGRFENLVASQLLKYCHFLEDTEGYKMELRYLKDIDGREVDFVVLQNKKPLFAVECKTGEKNISKHLYYFRERLKIPQFYQVHLGEITHKDGNILALPFESFCKKLKMP